MVIGVNNHIIIISIYLHVRNKNLITKVYDKFKTLYIAIQHYKLKNVINRVEKKIYVI